MLLAAVEAGKLLEVAVVSLAAGVSVTTLFAFVVRSGGKSAEARRAGNRGAWVLHGSLAMLCFLAFMGAVAFGVQVMLSKG